MNVWDRRFRDRARDPLIEAYNASIEEDRFLGAAEVRASAAYARALCGAGAIGEEDRDKILALLKEGKDFSDLARKYSTNTATAKDNGALTPFTRDNPTVPKALRDAAFALANPGQVSSVVQVGTDYHVLKLNNRVAPLPADFEKVKDKLRQDLVAALVEKVQIEILSELQRGAKIDFVNPTLRRAAEAIHPQP